MKYHKMDQHVQIFLSNFVPLQEIMSTAMSITVTFVATGAFYLDDEMFLFITLHFFLLWTGHPDTLAALGTRCTDIHRSP